MALVALVLITAVVCVRDHRPPGWTRRIVAVLGAVGYGFATMVVTAHGCGLGQPVAQWAVPAVCLASALMFIQTPRLRRVVAMTITAAGLALSFHYVVVVHGTEYVGVANPDPHYGIARSERQWHTPLTGLYRRGDGRGGRK